LPGIGHACGHNLIATSALGAAFALAAVQAQLRGTVRLLGTPAEEKGGGKELMARAGAFDGVDAAMIMHPSGINLTTVPCICVAEVRVEYHGRSAHASAMPHRRHQRIGWTARVSGDFQPASAHPARIDSLSVS
jgi:metal-dependent amidase/aminoacylase/carboxypeptidase family protein